MGGHIVLVVHNPEMHDQLIQSLAAEGYCALCFRSVEEAVHYLRESGCPAFVVVFNVTVRRQSDYSALSDLHHARPELHLLFVAQDHSPMLGMLSDEHEKVVVLEKPLNHPESGETIRQVLRSAPTIQDLDATLTPPHSSAATALPYSDEFLRRVGVADVPVLLSGETGVGKEVMARRLRAYSARANKPFLKLNCAALPPELAESELFGCVKGAFTGANADRQGRFETAQEGTILLDEIGDMDLRLQTKLLQVLQDGEIQPLGSNRTIKVNVRVMAATHRDLTRGIQEGTFREDLYYRLNVIKIVIPPLRDRRPEILPLAETLLARHLPAGQKAPRFTEKLKRFLEDYYWPGNVRELENVMRRFIVYQDPGVLMQELRNSSEEAQSGPSLTKIARFPGSSDSHSALDSRSSKAASAAASGSDRHLEEAPGLPKSPARASSNHRQDSNIASPDRLDRLAEASRLAETEVLLEALEASRWNRRQAAASLQIEYKAFLYKLQKYGIVDSKAKRREISA